MKRIQLFEGFTYNLILENKKKKDKKWIKKAIKHTGALHKSLGVKKDEKIPLEKITSKIEELEKEAKGDKKLDKKESKLLRRLNLAKTMKKFKKEEPPKEKEEDKNTTP
jgi:hypothetical protein